MSLPIITLETVEDDGLGVCLVCGEALARGEQIRRAPGGMSHDDCCKESDERVSGRGKLNP